MEDPQRTCLTSCVASNDHSLGRFAVTTDRWNVLSILDSTPVCCSSYVCKHSSSQLPTLRQAHLRVSTPIDNVSDLKGLCDDRALVFFSCHPCRPMWRGNALGK